MKKPKYLNVELDPKLMEAVKKAAELRGMKLYAFVALALKIAIERDGQAA